jgi:hypothetical protein
MRRFGVAGWWALALAGGVAAQAPPPGDNLLVPPAPPVFPRLADAVARKHQPAPVPPGMEIEVLDPNVDPRGNPAVVTRPSVVMTPAGPDGRVMVDIPPTVLVHRYYYTGDRTFQAGLLPGGPCVVVANHPKTGERLYVPVQLPPGAPRVTYTADAIEYDYRTQAVTISFCCLLHKGPKVTYRQGVPLAQKVESAVARTGDATRRLVNRTGLPEAVDKVAAGTKSAVVSTVDRANDLGERLVALPVALIRATPLGNLFQESPEDQAEKARNAEVRRATDRATRIEDSYLKTNR